MGVSELRDAWNAAAGAWQCSTALLGYARRSEVEMQVLTFRGTGPDGKPFEFKSDMLRPHTDLIAATGEAAANFLKSKQGLP